MLNIKIVFQNENFVLVDKPAGMLSVPSRHMETETRPVLGLLLKDQLQKPVIPVHRLDYEVSGLVLYALNPKAHTDANSWFAKKTVQKTYEALSLLNPEYPVGSKHEWKCRLLRGKKRAYEHQLGKASLTRAKILSQANFGGQNCLLWELTPLTGRAHQLRYEMYRHQCAIIGDTLYGNQTAYKSNQIALRAVKIEFPGSAKAWGLGGEYQVESEFRGLIQ